MHNLSELVVLKFDSYPNAIAWLDTTAGIAVRGESEYQEMVFTHVLFSCSMPEEQRLQILQYLPDARLVELRLPATTDHFCYSVGERRSAVVERLKALGMTVRKAACCMELISHEEGLDRIRELRIRTGQDLSEVPVQDLEDLYRRLYPG